MTSDNRSPKGWGNHTMLTRSRGYPGEELRRMCLFPTSIAKLRDTSTVSLLRAIRVDILTFGQNQHTTSFLDGRSYTFGEFDVGSLDLGPQKNIGTSLHSGAFRSEHISGNGYFARELLPDISKFPHNISVNDFKQRRDDLILTHAGRLVRLPKEIRLMIYEEYYLPSIADEGLTQYATPATHLLKKLTTFLPHVCVAYGVLTRC